ncbi:hypothetical protein BGZ83_001002 [Gryganskiella cystojenkinii]|nr:hypothetical protein BGZ83_001002 [Gryganskiella cystojenkinii]
MDHHSKTSTPNPSASHELALHSCTSKGTHELDYIPFAKTSNTIVKQLGNTISITPPFTLQDDTRWSPIRVDGDASVPRLNEIYLQDQDDVTHKMMPVPGKESRVQSQGGGNQAFELDRGDFDSLPLTPYGQDYETLVMPPPVEGVKGLRRLYAPPTLRMPHQRLHPISEDRVQPTNEVLWEIPPPKLSNRRIRKSTGSLNEKYSGMKYEMDVIAQVPVQPLRFMPYTRTLNHCAAGLPPPLPIVPEPMVIDTDQGQAVPGWSQPPLAPGPTVDNPPCPGQGTAQTSSLPVWVQDLDTRDNFAPDFGIANNTISTSATNIVSNHIKLNGGPFSTPHFRLSSPSTNRCRQNSSSPLHPPPRKPQAISNVFAESGVDDFDDDPELESILKDQTLFEDSFAHEGEQAESDAFSSSRIDSTIIASNMNLNIRPLPEGHGNGGADAESDGVLNQRPLTLSDRIHRLGREIREAAAASVPKFQSPTNNRVSPPQSRLPSSQQQQKQQRHVHQSHHSDSALSSKAQSRTVAPRDNTLGGEQDTSSRRQRSETEDHSMDDAHGRDEEQRLRHQRQKRRFQDSMNPTRLSVVATAKKTR